MLPFSPFSVQVTEACASVIITLEKILGYRSWRLTQALGDKTQMKSQKEPFIQMYSLIKCLILITKVQQGNILSGHKKKKHNICISIITEHLKNLGKKKKQPIANLLIAELSAPLKQHGSKTVLEHISQCNMRTCNTAWKHSDLQM